MKNKLTQYEVKKMFDYKDGNLFWKIKNNRCMQIGSIAGSADQKGYVKTKVNGVMYKNHRLIWLMHYGYLPEQIDHINGNRMDNRIENLRPATPAQNQWNRKLNANNTSGVKGVSWDKKVKKWHACIEINGKRKHLGRFSSLDNAKEFITLARAMIHENFANQGDA